MNPGDIFCSQCGQYHAPLSVCPNVVSQASYPPVPPSPLSYTQADLDAAVARAVQSEREATLHDLDLLVAIMYKNGDVYSSRQLDNEIARIRSRRPAAQSDGDAALAALDIFLRWLLDGRTFRIGDSATGIAERAEDLKNAIRCRQPAAQTCKWKKWGMDDDFYETECGNHFVVIEKIQDSGYRYCPGCGKPIEVVE